MKKMIFVSMAAAMLFCFGVIRFATASAQQPGPGAAITNQQETAKSCCGADAKGSCCGDSCTKKTGDNPGAMATMPGMAMAKTGDQTAGCCPCCGSDSCPMGKKTDGPGTGGSAAMPGMPGMPGMTGAKSDGDKADCCPCCGSDSCPMGTDGKMACTAMNTNTAGDKAGASSCCAGDSCCASKTEAKPDTKPKGR